MLCKCEMDIKICLFVATTKGKKVFMVVIKYIAIEGIYRGVETLTRDFILS